MDAPVSWQVNPDVVFRRLGDTVVLVNLSDNAIYELNPTGARAIELMASGATLDETVVRLADEFAADPAMIAGDVGHLVRELEARGLMIRTS